MSNFLAIATVTAALRRALQDAVDDDVPGAKVSTLRPDALNGTAGASGVNVFLYQATPNPAWRNADMPTRAADGRLLRRPRAALDLHYVLTFYGDEGHLEPQRLLGAVTRTLHERPVLTHAMIASTLADPTFNYLARSNLADEVELVRFTPTLLSLEELSKLWSVFFQTPYVLSNTYQGTVVFIDADATPRTPLPVRERMIYLRPFRHPVIEKVESAAGPREPIVIGGTLVIRGAQLRSEIVQVRLGGVLVAPTDVGEERVSLPLTSPPIPAEALRAGVQAIQLVQPMALGRPPQPHTGVESNAAAFVLRPKVTPQEATSEVVVIKTEPPVGPTQRIILLLNERADENPVSYSFPARPRDTDTDLVRIDVKNVKAADYWVRAQIDGAESLLDIDPASPGFGPEVRIP